MTLLIHFSTLLQFIEILVYIEASFAYNDQKVPVCSRSELSHRHCRLAPMALAPGLHQNLGSHF